LKISIPKNMNWKLTRRKFGQLAVASTTIAALGVLVNKTLAQTPNTVILGARPNVVNTDDSSSPVSNTTDNADETNTPENPSISPVQSIVVQSFNVATQEVKTVLTTPAVLLASEQFSGFASLKDGRLVVAATSFDTSKKARQTTRLIFLSDSPTSVNISGLKKQEIVQSLTRLQDGSLAALVGKKNGRPPNRTVTIDPQTGEITDRDKLQGNIRVTIVAQCPDNNIYGISTERKGDTSLYAVEGKKRTPLTFQGSPWISGFSGLVCSQSNVLFALGGRRYEYPNYIHTIDKNTGNIERLKGFDVAAIALA
jgi:hypothetical protein